MMVFSSRKSNSMYLKTESVLVDAKQTIDRMELAC